MTHKNATIVKELPGGWVKKLVQRASGQSEGKWDPYLTSPDGTRLRSGPELLAYIAKSPQFWPEFNAKTCNLDRPPECGVDGIPDGHFSPGTHKLIKFVELVNSGTSSDDAIALVSSQNKNNNNQKSQSWPRRKRKIDKGPTIATVRKDSFQPKKKLKHAAEFNGGGVTAEQTNFNGKKMSRENEMTLEKQYMANKCVPSPKKMLKWSYEMKLDVKTVTKFFRDKWRGKIEYEAKRGEREADAERSRQMQRFEADILFDDGFNYEDDDEFVIEHENAEDDL